MRFQLLGPVHLVHNGHEVEMCRRQERCLLLETGCGCPRTGHRRQQAGDQGFATMGRTNLPRPIQ